MRSLITRQILGSFTGPVYCSSVVTKSSLSQTQRGSDLRFDLERLLSESILGSRLPGERELAVRLGVARMTLRKAIDDLVAEGRVERRPGSGTFVTRPALSKELGLSSFSEDMIALGLTPGSRVVEFTRRPSSRTLAKQLRVPHGDPVVHIVRLRLANNEPMALEAVWLPSVFVPGLQAADVEGSLYGLLDARYGIRPVATTSTVAAIMPDRAVSKTLDVDPGQPCLLVEVTGVDQRGRMVYFARGTYRGDRYQVRTARAIESTRSPSRPAPRERR